MDFDEYVAARYGRLIEHAVLLGCAEGEAGTYVDQVLLEQRKRIRRAEDPDPLVHEALERAISGTPERSRRAGPLVAVGLVAVAVAVGAALTYRPPPSRCPRCSRSTASQASSCSRTRATTSCCAPARSCEPRGWCSSPTRRPGTRVAGGRHGHGPHRGTVRRHLRVAVRQPGRRLGVRQLRARRRPAAVRRHRASCSSPAAPPRTFAGPEASDGGAWDEAFDLIATAAHRAAPTVDRDAVAPVDIAVPPDRRCDVPRPPETGPRFALRLQIDARQARSDVGCPLTIDLYRSERVIDTVVVYPARADAA